MKWFFAINEGTLTHKDHGFPGLMLAAVASAIKNTDLQPHLLYDGNESDLIRRLRTMGVVIVPHRLSFYDHLAANRPPGYGLGIAAGTFLRIDIPDLVPDDEFVLYTDCDVIFTRQPNFIGRKPEFFAAAPQSNPLDYADMNAGVMLMNVPGMRAELGNFRSYITTNFASFQSYDQTAYLQFYKDRYMLLPPEANWKPYWGVNDEADIIHFHGPKPDAVRKLLANPEYEAPASWRRLFGKDPEAYRRYLEIWDGHRASADH